MVGLTLFGGLALIVEMVGLSNPDVWALRTGGTVLWVIGWGLLWEYGRRSLRHFDRQISPIWLGELLLLYLVFNWFGRWEGYHWNHGLILGIPACSLTVWHFLHLRRIEPEKGRLHIAGAVAVLGYGLSHAFISMNEPWVRIAQIGLFTIAAFAKKKSIVDSRANGFEIGIKVYLATLFLTVLAGVWAAYWRGVQTDQEIRAKLLNQTTEIAGAVDPNQASKLLFTAEDADNPIYGLFRDYFTSYGRMIDQKSIYTMKVRDGSFFFGPENIPEKSSDASPPGTKYLEPSEECWRSFNEAKPVVEGPVADEYGEYITGMAPVIDPATGQTILLIGMDVLTDEWRAKIAKSRLGAILFTLCMGALIIGGNHLASRLNQAGAGRQYKLRYTEGVFSALAGIVLTLNVAFFVRDREDRSQAEFFNYLAKAQSQAVKQSIDLAIKGDIASVRDFVRSDMEVGEEEFKTFTQSLLNKKSISQLYWIEASGDKSARAFALKHVNRRPGDNSDHNPVGRLEENPKEIETAVFSGLPMLTPSWEINGEHCEMVFQPVQDRGGQLKGFVGALINLEAMTHGIIEHYALKDDLISVTVSETAKGGRYAVEASYPTEAEFDNTIRDGRMVWKFPVFMPGKCHGITIRPTDRFMAMNPARMEWVTLVLGFIVTGVASAFIGMLGNRRVLLEQQVAQRTSVLREINAELQIKRQESEMHTRDIMTLLDGLPGFAYLKGRDGKYLAANKAFCDLAGLPEEKLLGRTCVEVFPKMAEEFQKIDRSIFSGEKGITEVLDRFAQGDYVRWFLVRRLPICRSDGTVERLVGFGLDMTEQRRAQLKLRQLSAAVEQSPVTIMITDLDGTITFANSAFTQSTGYELHEVIGMKTSMLRSGKTDETVYRRLWETIKSGGQWRGELLNRKKNGELFWEQLIISPMADEHGKITHYLAVKEDISQRKKMEQDLRAAARLDKLTSLPNRSLLLDRLQHAILRRKRNPNNEYAVLFLDFDRFKIVNDSLGHDVGDQLLIEIAERLKNEVRTVDSVSRVAEGNTAARLGGDEFVILLEEIKDPTDAAAVAERILTALAKPYQIGRYKIVSTASIGVVTGGEWYERAEDVLRDADTAMYEAKLAGKGQYVLFDTEMQKGIRRRMDMENDLRKAIDAQQFELHYQPIVSMETGAIESVEALVRWRHPEHGLIAPGEFISLAEECGLIEMLGDWVFKTAAHQLGIWWKKYGKEKIPGVSVNLSREQIMGPGLAERLIILAGEAGVEPGAIHLEITESTVMRNVEAAGMVLKDLKMAGFKLDMDDFGTGYSSLSCLHQFPMDVLKVDRSFVVNLDRGHDYAALVGAICALAQSLNIKVIAEGIETVEQLKALMLLNCHYAQGYYLGRPMPPEVLENHILPELPGLYKKSA